MNLSFLFGQVDRSWAFGKLGNEAKRAQKNSELFSELFRVVFTHSVDDRQFFGDWVDTLNQGGSLEGMYNALVHSHFYRHLEKQTIPKNKLATLPLDLEKLKSKKISDQSGFEFFIQELLWIRGQLKPKSSLEIRTDSGQPLPVMGLEQLLGDQNQEKTVKAAELLKDTEVPRVFISSSPFVLKRVLGDAALKLIDQKKQNRADLAQWYSALTLRLSRSKVYFGLELRHRLSRKFHRNWALKASEDLLKWETLNRYHRILNQKLVISGPNTKIPALIVFTNEYEA